MTTNTLRDLIIKDNYTSGNYCELVMMMKENGYINVTKLCKDGGKEFFNWKANKISEIFLDEVSSNLQICKNDILTSIPGCNKPLCGTYAHPDLVPHIASWISPKFAVKVSSILSEWRKLSSKNEMDYWNSMGECILSQTKKTIVEHVIRDRLALLLNGEIEFETEFGKADVVSDKEVIEIKRLCNWKYALGQVLIYTTDPVLSGKTMRIHLFDYEQVSVIEINKIEKVCTRFGCEVTFELVN